MYRLSTKEDRLNSQAIQFETLLKSGYIQEVYKGLNIFIYTKDKLLMKVFKGTSSKHISFFSYRSIERMNQVKQELKDGYDRQTTYKEERKKNHKKSSHAACAAAIKQELTALYPHIKFSVKSESFSMGDSVDVSYTDGPASAEIDGIIKKYQYGHFNGMDDLYENTNSRDDIPQSKYVSCRREMSKEVEEAIKEDAEKYFNPDHYINIHTAQQFANCIFYNTSVPAGATVTGIKEKDLNGGFCSPENFFTLAFDTQVTKEPIFTPTEVKPGNVKIIDYSEKAIAVIGDTKPIKEKLKSLKGSFNPRLTCGPGWIFPKTRLEEIKEAISQPATFKDEVKKTIEALAEIDKANTGKISDSVKEAARVQKITLEPEHEIYNNLHDIEEAAKGGKVISLLNLCQLANQ